MSNNTMKRSWLVQRLRKPYRNEGVSSGPFAFGGGYKDGGLSQEALELFKDLFRFDYMGAAEFEFGEVPKAFNKIAVHANDGDLTAWSFSVKLSDVEPDWRALPKEARYSKSKKHWKTDGEGTIYCLAKKEWADEVESRVRGWASERYNRDLKEMTQLASTLRPHTEWDGETQGWLELNNGYMFFTDYDMWKGMCKLFGVDVESDDGK